LHLDRLIRRIMDDRAEQLAGLVGGRRCGRSEQLCGRRSAGIGGANEREDIRLARSEGLDRASRIATEQVTPVGRDRLQKHIRTRVAQSTQPIDRRQSHLNIRVLQRLGQ
jgi:hypothetical protein